MPTFQLATLQFASLAFAASLIALPGPRALAAETLNAATVNEAQPSPKSKAGAAQGAVMLRAQVLLDRAEFSPGAIDGKSGENARHAITAFQKARGLRADGKLDQATFAKLLETGSEPALIEYKIAEGDVKGPFVAKIPKDLEQMAALDHLGYASPLDLLAEKFPFKPGAAAGAQPRTNIRRRRRGHHGAQCRRPAIRGQGRENRGRQAGQRVARLRSGR